jgi:hypothetical protein
MVIRAQLGEISPHAQGRFIAAPADCAPPSGTQMLPPVPPSPPMPPVPPVPPSSTHVTSTVQLQSQYSKPSSETVMVIVWSPTCSQV